MLPSQFSPLNYFGIDGDILRVDKLASTNTGYKSSEISFYNLNPNKIYENIATQPTFDSTTSEYINFYNFNQDELTLRYNHIYSFLFYFARNLKKINFDGTIIIEFIVDYYADIYPIQFLTCMFSYTNKLDFSNIILKGKLDTFYPKSIAWKCFEGCNIFGFIDKNKKIKDFDIDFYRISDLTYTYTGCLRDISYDFNKLMGIKNIDENITIGATDMSYFLNQIEIIDYTSDITNFFSNVPFRNLRKALGAFSTLGLHKTDVKTLANNLNTHNDSGEHIIGVGLKDSTVTEQELTEIQSMYTDKGWTLSLNQIPS